MTKKQLLSKIKQWQKLQAEITLTINTEFFGQFCNKDCCNCELGICDESSGCKYCLFFDASAQEIETRLKKKIESETK